MNGQRLLSPPDWQPSRVKSNPHKMTTPITGLLNEAERRISRATVKESSNKPRVVVEVGTWLGEGAPSTCSARSRKMAKVMSGESKRTGRFTNASWPTSRRQHPSSQSLRAATLKLLWLRLHPFEIAAAILPSWFCGFALGLLPSRFSRRLSDGAKQQTSE